MQRLYFTSLRARLISLVMLCVLPVLGLTIYNSVEDRRLAIARVRKDMRKVSEIATAQQSQTIANAHQLLVVLAKIRRATSNVPNECTQLLQEILKSYPLYDNLGVVKPNGQLVCSAARTTQKNISERQTWLQQTINKRNFTVGSYAHPRNRPATIVFSYPVFNDRSKVESVIFLTLNSSWLNQLAPEIPLPEGGSLSVFDRNGIVIARYPQLQDWQLDSTVDVPAIKQMLLEGKNIAEVSGVDGSQHLYVPTVKYSASTDAYIAAVGISQVEPFAQADRTLRRNLLGLTLVAAIAIAIAWLGSELFWIRPLNKLVSATQRLAAGDLGTRVNLPNRHEELSQLARTFDYMAASLESQLTEIKQAEAQVRQLNHTLEQRVAERTAQLELANKELEAFAYSVSHDLRAPLRHISGFVEALARQLEGDRTNGDRIAHYIDVIQASSQKMGQLIDALLGLARIGQKPLIYQLVDVRPLVDRAIAIVKHHTEVEDRDRIDFTVAELPSVMGDSALLQQVFSNLIDNAVKFSRLSHPPKITIGALTDGTIFIQDNGVGFAMEHADKLFAAFQRLHSPKDFPGTGIGLAIVQRIVHRHNSTIWFESQVNKGTTFFIKFPETS